jgi:hypothetical protein
MIERIEVKLDDWILGIGILKSDIECSFGGGFHKF